MEPRGDDDGGCLLPLLLALHAETRTTSNRNWPGSKPSVKVVWGEKDLYIKKEMGVEFAERVHAELTLLPGIGHYPHLQTPKHVIDEVRASFR